MTIKPIDVFGALVLMSLMTGPNATTLSPVPDSAMYGPGTPADVQTGQGPGDTHRYIIRFDDAPLASYRGNIAGLAATNPDALRAASGEPAAPAHVKLDTGSAASVAYLAYLDDQHDRFQARLQELVSQPETIYRYHYALNGMAVRMTEEEAVRVSAKHGVAAVQRDQLRQLQTANSVSLIGAPQIWDGSATGGLEARGEGVLIGVIDSGINTDHPSFAEVSPGDGYVHINPLGNNVFLHDCAPFDAVTNPNGGQRELCNNKLIGTKVLPWVADLSGQNNAEDFNGHGSHAAGIAGGNILLDVPYVGAGGPTGIVFDSISGVAPRANLVAYKVCSSSGCALSDLLAAIDVATADGVDIINYSIGSGATDPWIDPDSLAFLGARDAGVFVTAAIGRSGPGPGSIGSPAVSPWLTSVAASTHQRGLTDSVLTDLAGGDTIPPDDIPGRGATGGYGPAPIVYAGDFGDPLCPLHAFLPNTFNGAIVVCDRGSYALVDKAQSAAAGGAGAVIIASTATSGQGLFDLPYVIPGLLILVERGDLLREWLSSGAGHTGRIAGAVPFVDDSLADVVATFSSRGPNPFVPDIISPNISAPGVDLYAPYYTPVEYAAFSGTSAAAAHVSGGAALLRQVHPDWSAAEIHSALASTGQRFLIREEDGLPATPFEFGGGRIQLERAVNAGLVMHETTANFRAANPALDGDPTTLNLPSFGNADCQETCTWQRTLRATTDATWVLSAESGSGLDIDISPQTFTLEEDETVTITVSANVQNLPPNDWYFGWIHLAADDVTVSAQSYPIAVYTLNLDIDADEVPDETDNCILVPNADQRDTDGDGYGNLCDADLNNDCIVDAVDMGIVGSVFLTDDPDADLNGDGLVNFPDLGLFRLQFGQPPGPSANPAACF